MVIVFDVCFLEVFSDSSGSSDPSGSDPRLKKAAEGVQVAVCMIVVVEVVVTVVVVEPVVVIVVWSVLVETAVAVATGGV